MHGWRSGRVCGVRAGTSQFVVSVCWSPMVSRRKQPRNVSFLSRYISRVKKTTTARLVFVFIFAAFSVKIKRIVENARSSPILVVYRCNKMVGNIQVSLYGVFSH